MKFRPAGKIALLVFIAAAVLLALFRTAKRSPVTAKPVAAEIEGVNLTYLSFNKDNEKKLEVRCAESLKGEDGRLHMREVVATVFKADKLDEDVHITAASGHTNDDFNDFHLQGDVRIVSPTFSLSSPSFSLRDLNELSTRDAAAFTLRDMSGQARGGLLYVFTNKTLRMIRPEGTLMRAGKAYRFQARIIRLNEKKKWVLLDQEARMDGSGSQFAGDRIVMQFDQDFANMQEATATGHCFFQAVEIGEDGRQRTREILAERIKMTNDAQGRLQGLRVSGNGVISLEDGQTSGKISSQIIEISLNAETQSLEKVQTLARGEMSSRGRDNMSVGADALLAVYNGAGALERVRAERNGVFATDDFSGSAPLLDYDVPHERIVISGKEAAVVSKKNAFASSRFVIQTRSRRLATDQGVKATLVPGKKSVLLKRRPVYVTASGMELSEKGDVTRFKEKVRLFQEEIELHAGELLFESQGNRIGCLGGVDMNFLNENERVTLQGKTMTFHPEERTILIEGDARLRQGENMLAARKIELIFSGDDKLKDIQATDEAAFSRKDLSGKARLLIWHYSQRTVLFRNSAEITRSRSGTTRGEELLFNLDSNEITVSGEQDRSETTIRRDRP